MKQRLFLVSALRVPKPSASFGPYIEINNMTRLVQQTPPLAVWKSDAGLRSKNSKLCKIKKTALEEMIHL